MADQYATNRPTMFGPRFQGSAAGSTPVWLLSSGSWVDSSRAWAYGTTSTVAQVLENTTAAALGAQQVSPGMAWLGRGWETAGGTSQVVGAMIDVLPVQGTSCSATMQWKFKTSTAGAWGAAAMTLSSGGAVGAASFATGGGNISGGGIIAAYGYSCTTGYDNVTCGLGSAQYLFTTTAGTPIGICHSGRTDGANNIVAFTAYKKGSAITNAATMRLHSFGVTLDAVPTYTEVASFRCNGDLYVHGAATGQGLQILSLTELTTIAAAATTDTTIAIPANAIVLAVSVRVTVLIPTAATFTVIGTTTSTVFQTGASVAVAATTTNVGNTSCPYLNVTAQTIRITPNAQPGDNSGRVRVTIHYITNTAPTS